MTNERLKSPRARLFVALELPAGARTALREWQRDLDGRAPGELRPVATDALHLTLAFIGYRPERDIDDGRIGDDQLDFGEPAGRLLFR